MTGKFRVKNFYEGKKVLVAGGTGLIGRPLVEMLRRRDAIVYNASMDGNHRCDLREFSNCESACQGKDIVFNLVGVKGSPSATKKYPARFFTPILQTSINMMEAARRAKVKHYLYTSTVGVYPPAEVFHEGDMWDGFPSPNDWYAGWAKRMGELQAAAYAEEFGFRTSIVRPANVYGPWDNFDSETAMVLPSLIARVVENDGPLTVWGSGAAYRDFIHAEDVAAGTMLAVEKGIHEPINLGSGNPVTIADVAELVAKHAPGGPREIVWDQTMPGGDNQRVMDMTKAAGYGFHARVGLEDGIRDTIAWYGANRDAAKNRYIAFNDEAYQ
jgi:GDP-L-fucose synthase